MKTIAKANERPGTVPTAVVLDEFLVASEWRSLLNYTLRNERKFSPAEVLDANDVSKLDTQYRRSQVLYEFGPFKALFRQRLLTFLPYVLNSLGIQPFRVSKLELQLTAINHAEFFRVHSDNSTDDVAGRYLTFVYYFHREPRMFAGGELKLFEAKGAEYCSDPRTPYRLIFPLQNQVVFFLSCKPHEVLPVLCPSRRFIDGRFTVNGWYHQ